MLLLYSESLAAAFWLNFVLTAFAACCGGVPPQHRRRLGDAAHAAVAGAYFILLNTFIGLALGPYFMGLLSDLFFARGMNEAEALRTAIAVSLLTLIPALLFMILAHRHLPGDEATRLDRARALGEAVDA